MECVSPQSKRQCLRQVPQHYDKADYGGYCLQQPLHEAQRLGSKRINIFRNTLIRVIPSAAGKDFHSVIHIPCRPPGQILFCHPPAPSKRQLLLKIISINGESDIGKSITGELNQPMINGLTIIVLQRRIKGIEPVIEQQCHIYSRYGKRCNKYAHKPGFLPFFSLPV